MRKTLPLPLYNNQQVVLQSTFTVTSFEPCKILQYSCHPFLMNEEIKPRDLNNLSMVIQLVMVEPGFVPKSFDPEAWVPPLF